MPFADVSSVSSVCRIVSHVVGWILGLDVHSPCGDTFLPKLSPVSMVLLPGVGSPCWAQLHVSIDGSFVDLGLLKVSLVSLDNVWSLSVSFSNSFSSLLETCCPSSPLAGIDETSSGTLGRDHLGLPSGFLNLCGA